MRPGAAGVAAGAPGRVAEPAERVAARVPAGGAHGGAGAGRQPHDRLAAGAAQRLRARDAARVRAGGALMYRGWAP